MTYSQIKFTAVTDVALKQKPKAKKMRRLFYDLEVSPNVVFSWNVGYDIRLNPNSIIKERAVICIGYKWQHEKEAKCLSWDEKQCDKKMLLEFLEIAGRADELVAQNGDKFDLPWLKTRWLFHGVKTIPRFKTADTLQWARRQFRFNSNKLDYMAEFLGIGNKLHTDFDLWRDIVLNKDKAAMKKMVDYCKQDVLLLERVWNRLQLAVSPKQHNAVLLGGSKWQCPRCASDEVQLRGKSTTAGGTIHHRAQCMNCGGWFQMNGATKKQYEEDNKK